MAFGRGYLLKGENDMRRVKSKKYSDVLVFTTEPGKTINMDKLINYVYGRLARRDNLIILAGIGAGIYIFKKLADLEKRILEVDSTAHELADDINDDLTERIASAYDRIDNSIEMIEMLNQHSKNVAEGK